MVIAIIVILVAFIDKQDKGLVKLQNLNSLMASGIRKDAFRCSDAKKYFAKVKVEVDCKHIDMEVTYGY